jgi:hypothetical protein
MLQAPAILSVLLRAHLRECAHFVCSARALGCTDTGTASDNIRHEKECVLRQVKAHVDSRVQEADLGSRYTLHSAMSRTALSEATSAAGPEPSAAAPAPSPATTTTLGNAAARAATSTAVFNLTGEHLDGLSTIALALLPAGSLTSFTSAA